MNINLPADYLDYVESGGVTEELTDDMPGYFQLWPLGEVESNNRQLNVERYAPGFLGFGGDGGGELLAFDETGAVFMLPMIGMESKYANRIANNWCEVVQRIRSSD